MLSKVKLIVYYLFTGGQRTTVTLFPGYDHQSSVLCPCLERFKNEAQNITKNAIKI